MTPTIGASAGRLWSRLWRRRAHRHVAHYEGVLGTSLELQFVCGSADDGARAERAALREIDRLEAVFSAYLPTSELRRWEATLDEEVAVSAELAEVLEASEGWRLRTGGAFNPAVEALTRLWKEHAAAGRMVSDARLGGLAAQLASPLWEVDRARPTARRRTRLPVTLNAIAKGFIIDAACECAAGGGVREALVNIGGDLRHRGGQGVAVAVADPFADAENAPPVCVVHLREQGMATSGGYRRGFRVGERWLSHLIDPRSGRPVERVVSASVIAPTAATADALATALSVLSPGEGLALADSLPDIACLLITDDGAQTANSAWEARLVDRGVAGHQTVDRDE
jgi:thiamine biosynthesis lipoprotein